MEVRSGERGQWGSKIGFILAAAGSAIGLGNIWRFPYVTGVNGGAAFVVVYLLCVLLICLPYLFAELALGRFTRRNPVGAIRAVRPKSPWILVGALGVLTGFFILSYYAVIAGWSLGYIVKTFTGDTLSHGTFVAQPARVIILFGVFMFLTVLVVHGGVQKGIERWSKVLMPLLFLLMLAVIVRGVTLPGAEKGLEFYLAPDFSKINGKVILAALGQAFYSLSLGMGLMVTYGSYISKKDNLLTSGMWVALFDTVIALMAGLMIFPALFALQAHPQPGEGPSLVFVTLPGIFESMPGGRFIGAAFFLLLSIAALTSTISLLEVPTAYLVDEWKWKRKTAVWIAAGIIFFLGLPSALSCGAVDWLGKLPFDLDRDGSPDSFLGLMDFLFGNISLAVGALLLSIFVGWIWGAAKGAAELEEGSRLLRARLPLLPLTWGRVWGLFVCVICPVVIFIVLLNIFKVFG